MIKLCFLKNNFNYNYEEGIATNARIYNEFHKERRIIFILISQICSELHEEDKADTGVCPYNFPNFRFTIYGLRSLLHPHLNPLPAYAKALADRPSRARKKYWEIYIISNFPSTGGREQKGGRTIENNLVIANEVKQSHKGNLDCFVVPLLAMTISRIYYYLQFTLPT
jgi:hypothetical protein